MKKIKLSRIIILFSILIGLAFLAYIALNINKNNLVLLLNSLLLTLISIILLFPSKKVNNGLIGLLLICITGLNAYTFAKPEEKKEIKFVANMYNMNLNEVLEYAKENNIELIQNYDYSDYIEKYHIISQDINNEELENVKKLNIIISNGPNYSADASIPNFVGLELNELLEYKNKNFLNNIEITFVKDDSEPNTIIYQSKTGNIKRNTKIEIKVSKKEFSEIEMIDLKNKSLFEAKLWLDENSINYELKYDFSELDKNYVVNQSIDVGTTIKEEDSIILTISKGPSIKVPNLKEMTTEEIMKWITDNNLEIIYKEEYNKDVELGKVISVNYEEEDIIEQGTEIIIVTSKGSLKMIKFTNLYDFKDWANANNVKYEVEYSFSDSISKGELIKSSHEENAIITDNDTVTLTLSNGKAVTVPNFKGMSKSEITTKCNSIGLTCQFKDYGYTTSTKANIAVTQSVSAGKQVVSGSYVTISLSKGIAQTYTVQINETDLVINNSSKTIERLKSLFASKYPGVTFKFVTKASNTYNNAGFIHENSAVKNGTKVTQGKTYTVTITS